MIADGLRVRLKSLECGSGGKREPFGPNAPYEFHVSARIRRACGLDDSLFTLSGNVIFPNFHAVRGFAQKLNDYRDARNHPERNVKAGQLNAMGLIDEIMHYMIRWYDETGNPGVFGRILGLLAAHFG